MNYTNSDAPGLKNKVVLLFSLSSLLSVVFCLFFMFTKHQVPYAQIIPFGNDPYDAIGSFAFLLSPFLLILGFTRLLKNLIQHDFRSERRFLLARTLAAIPLSVLLVLYSDCIALARYQQSWVHSSKWLNLLCFLAAMALFSVVTLIVIQHSIYASRPSTTADYKKALIILVPYTLVLAIYPNGMIHSLSGELLRLAVSVILFFVPLAQLLPIVIRSNEPCPAASAAIRKSPKRFLTWLLVIFSGIAVGLLALYEESAEGSDGGHHSLVPALIMVTFVYVGTTVFAAVTAYITLRKPLGLF